MRTEQTHAFFRRLRVAGLIGVVVGLGACSLQPPKPWQKGILAKPQMTMESDALDNKFSQHTYGSKEGSSGGYGVGGGGCGCN